MDDEKGNEKIEQKDNLIENEIKKKSVWRYPLRIAAIFIIIAVVYTAIIMMEKFQIVNSVFENIEDGEVSLTEYIIYGTHLNVKGKLNIDTSNISDVKLCFKSVNEQNTKEINLSFTKDTNAIDFSTSDLINEGIYLENLDPDMYYLFIKVIDNEGISKYYSLRNTTKYNDATYYTITRNNKNKKINIGFSTHEANNKDINYMYLSVYYESLPEDVYDIVIDPGHGGKDVGAEANGYREADLTLRFALKVKRELENLGFKVKITRDGTEGEKIGKFTVYDKNGRVNITGVSKAKYVFSIHLNSIQKPDSEKGVEIYAPTKIDLKMAKAFADNIVKFGKTKYSDLAPNYRVTQGVYVRTFTEEGIAESVKAAKEKGYEPYNIKPNTPYLYMLRETGGIATNAYVDGRNPEYGKNLYYDSNIGLEAYLLELGYINNKSDLQNMLNNQDGYVEGIVKTIQDEIFERI